MNPLQNQHLSRTLPIKTPPSVQSVAETPTVGTTEGVFRPQLRTGGSEANNFLRRMLQPWSLDGVATQVSSVRYCYWCRFSFPVSIALQEQGRIRGGSARARSEQVDRSTPVLRSNEKDSSIRDQGEHEDRGTGVQQPSETGVERTSGGGQDSGDTHDLVQSGESKRKSRCSSYTTVRIDNHH